MIGADEILEGVWKNAVSKERFQKNFPFEIGVLTFFVSFKTRKNPEGLNLDQISSYCTSIQILMRSLQYANMIIFRSHPVSNLIL